MLRIVDLDLGFSDAENYRNRENKRLFEQLFVRNEYLDDLLKPSISFLIGEKGTGKTAYATYISNTSYKNHYGAARFIRETEYQKFVTLKKERQLNLSDYVNIWKVIIYLLIAQQIRDTEKGSRFFAKFQRFHKLEKAVDEYYANAFSPEIINALQFVESSKLAAELIAKYTTLGVEAAEQVSFSESRFQTNLMYIQRKFEDALGELKLSKNHIVFIDGIDIRPSAIPYDDYLDCIKGLANAVWSINNDFLSQIKDSKGRMRAILLVRPDIFQSLGLQNQNTKIRDNSVLLDWRTTYKDHRNSFFFEVSDRLLSVQQPRRMSLGESWDHYFPFDTKNLRDKFDVPSSFVHFMRLSLYRPRDIITVLGILQENVFNSNEKEKLCFTLDDAQKPAFTNKYGEYLLGEVKDHLLFYYSTQDYENFLKFFQFLRGAIRFGYEKYLDAFGELDKYLAETGSTKPPFMSSANMFLQFLFTLNVISYIEESRDGQTFIRWCFRERSYSNIAPKVQTRARYEIHYGLVPALNIGKKLK